MHPYGFDFLSPHLPYAIHKKNASSKLSNKVSYKGATAEKSSLMSFLTL